MMSTALVTGISNHDQKWLLTKLVLLHPGYITFYYFYMPEIIIIMIITIIIAIE